MLKLKRFFKDREVFLFAPIYFFLSLINLRVKLSLTPFWFQGLLSSNHRNLLIYNYANNEQSRLLQFYVPEALRHLLRLSIEHAYLLQRWLFVFLAFMLFHKYLRKWFDAQTSFAGVVFLAAIMPLSYFNHLQESAPLLMVTFLLGLWAIRENKIGFLLLVFFVGGLNNETMLALPLVYFFYHFKSWKFMELARLSGRTILVSLPLLLTVGPIRYFNRYRPHGANIWQLPYNLQGIARDFSGIASWPNFLNIHGNAYLYIFIIFNVFWVYAFIKYKDLPLFLRRAALMIPFFIIAHMLTGIIMEVRQMIPLSFIIIPMALFFLFKQEGIKV